MLEKFRANVLNKDLVVVLSSLHIICQKRGLVQPCAFICFEAFGTPDETRSMSF